MCERPQALGLTVYDCLPDEAARFAERAWRHGVVPTTTAAAASDPDAGHGHGNRCASVSHRSEVAAATLVRLREAGVEHLSTRSVGLDHVDLDAAAALGITVENVPYAPDGVADFTVMLALLVVRGAKDLVDSHDVADRPLVLARTRELRDLTVGVVGAGRIGSAVIERLQGFGCRVVVHDRGRAGSASLDELLRSSDLVTLHLPLTAATHHVIGLEQVGLMRPGALLVNTARGALVDTGALIAALEDGRLGGAALDVLEGEAAHRSGDRAAAAEHDEHLRRLRRLPNVVVTPHAAWFTGRALHDTVDGTLAACVRFDREAARA